MRRHGLILLLLSAALIVAGYAQDQQKRAMTTNDDLNLVDIGDVMISPDGSMVFYSKTEPDWDRKAEGRGSRGKKTYYMKPAAGGDEIQFIGEAGGSEFQFSPDGQYISLKRRVKKEQQIHTIRVSGGEAIQLTKHENSVGRYKWSLDSKKIFFVADEPQKKDAKDLHEAGYDAVFVDEGPNGQSKDSWASLWVYDIEKKEEKRLTEDQILIRSFDPSPDGKRIAYTARTENRRNQGNLSEIYVLEIESGNKVRITDNKAPEGSVLWSPDGQWIAFDAPSQDGWELRNEKIWLTDAEGKSSRMISGEFEGNIWGFVWSLDGKSILFNGLQRTDTNLYRLDVSSGQLERLTSLTGTLRVADYSKDRSRIAYTFSDFDTPPDLYTSPLDEFQPTRLTEANPWFEKEVLTAHMEVIRWNSKDGLEIEGLFFLPADYKEGTRIPLMLNIHGGPAGVFTNSFRGSYHVYAGLGYASLCPNVRGSSGYSDDLLRGNMKDIGGGDYEDLMTGVDHVIEKGIADPEKLALRGWSYGGILGGWTITQTQRFKAASVGAMVTDWTSEYGPGFNHDVRLWYIGGTPWENPEGYRQKSSLTHVASITTPTIIFHGEEDTTDTEAQSMMFFTALKDQGKTVRYLKFPREPHGFREPRHQQVRDVEEIRWMQKYVMGIDWEAWELPDKPKKDDKKDDNNDAEENDESADN